MGLLFREGIIVLSFSYICMGLDMYLIRHKKINEPKPEMTIEEPTREDQDNFQLALEIWKDKAEWDSDYAYWRKFNALHNYFCLKAGRDINCESFELSAEIIVDVLEKLKEVDKDHSKANILLPSCEGFFFGGVEYDEWYFKDISDSIKTFERALEDMKEGYVFEYDAWW